MAAGAAYPGAESDLSNPLFSIDSCLKTLHSNRRLEQFYQPSNSNLA